MFPIYFRKRIPGALGNSQAAFSFSPGNFADNAYFVSTIQTSPGGRVVIATEADYMVVQTYNDVNSSFGDCGVRVNDSDLQSLPNPVSGYKYFPLNIGVLGVPKIVELINGIQSYPTTKRRGSWVIDAWFNGDARIVSDGEPTTPRILVYGDSIDGGEAAGSPSLQGWVQLLRNAYQATGSVLLEAWGYRSLKRDCETAGDSTAFAALIASVAPSIIWLSIGTNDYGLNEWSAADFGTAYGRMLDDLHAALPSAVLYAQTPITRGNESANTFGNTLGDYRTQIGTEQSSRSAFCTLVDGTMLTTYPGDYAGDGVHLTTTGQANKFSAVASLLGI